MALIAQMFEGEAGGPAADRRAGDVAASDVPVSDPPGSDEWLSDQRVSDQPVLDRRAELARLRLLVDTTGTAPARRTGADVAPEDDADDVVPVLPTLRQLLPGGVLRRGSVVAVEDGVRSGFSNLPHLPRRQGPPDPRGAAGRAGAPNRDAVPPYAAAPSYLALALAAGASAGGGWCGVVGLPALGIAAAAGLGADLRRMLLLDEPGERWAEAVAVLAGAVNLILVRPPGRPTAEQLRRVTARLRRTARQRGAALVVAGAWHGAHVTLRTTQSVWTGLGTGQGHLTGRRVTVVAEGRGAQGRPRTALLWLPAADGSVASAAGVLAGRADGSSDAAAVAAVVASTTATVATAAAVGRAEEDRRELAEVVRLRSA